MWGWEAGSGSGSGSTLVSIQLRCWNSSQMFIWRLQETNKHKSFMKTNFLFSLQQITGPGPGLRIIRLIIQMCCCCFTNGSLLSDGTIQRDWMNKDAEKISGTQTKCDFYQNLVPVFGLWQTGSSFCISAVHRSDKQTGQVSDQNEQQMFPINPPFLFLLTLS